MSGLVRARGLKPWKRTGFDPLNVRARKSPWIETHPRHLRQWRRRVRARKSPWIETDTLILVIIDTKSGLVRARGLKRESIFATSAMNCVRARKSPWIETNTCKDFIRTIPSGLVRARGLKHTLILQSSSCPVRGRRSPWIETKKLFISSRILCQGS